MVLNEFKAKVDANLLVICGFCRVLQNLNNQCPKLGTKLHRVLAISTTSEKNMEKLFVFGTASYSLYPHKMNVLKAYWN